MPKTRNVIYPHSSDEETRIVKEVKDLNLRMIVLHEKLDRIERILIDYTCHRINKSKEEDKKPEPEPEPEPKEVITSWLWT